MKSQPTTPSESLKSQSARTPLSHSSSELEIDEENEQVFPLGGTYVPQRGSLFSNRKFEFMHI